MDQISTSSTRWWLSSILLPAIFLLLGAIISSGSTWVRDLLNSRGKRRAFLKAIRSELETLLHQVGNSIAVAEGSKQRIKKREFPHFVSTFSTAVYYSQLNKLDDVANEDTLEVIRTYANIADVTETMEVVNGLSQRLRDFDYSHPVDISSALRMTQYAGAHREIMTRLDGACEVMLDRMKNIERQIAALLTRLPQ